MSSPATCAAAQATAPSSLPQKALVPNPLRRPLNRCAGLPRTHCANGSTTPVILICKDQRTGLRRRGISTACGKSSVNCPMRSSSRDQRTWVFGSTKAMRDLKALLIWEKCKHCGAFKRMPTLSNSARALPSPNVLRRSRRWHPILDRSCIDSDPDRSARRPPWAAGTHCPGCYCATRKRGR